MSNPALVEGNLLGNIPGGLKKELIEAYGHIVRNFRERRWEPAELNGGKLCEIVYTILKGYIDGSYPAKSKKPNNMVDACKKLESYPSSIPRSVRIQVPRMITALYEIRNNRGVGHAGGDVDPNHMDAVCVLEMSKWIMSELVRIFHNVTTDDARMAIDNLIERTVPTVWKVGDNIRVLNPRMSMKDKAMLLLYNTQGTTSESDLFKWVEHSNASVFRRDIIRRAHKAKLVEYDPVRKTVEISPLGIRYVENHILA